LHPGRGGAERGHADGEAAVWTGGEGALHGDRGGAAGDGLGDGDDVPVRAGGDAVYDYLRGAGSHTAVGIGQRRSFHGWVEVQAVARRVAGWFAGGRSRGGVRGRGGLVRSILVAAGGERDQ